MKNKCGECACWDWNGKTDDGICRANPPKPQVAITKSDTAMQKEGLIFRCIWPSTNRNDGCYHNFVQSGAEVEAHVEV